MNLPAPLTLAPAARARAERIGAEGTAIAIVDDCLKAPDEAAAFAATLGYAPIGPHYPGIRASLGSDAAAAIGAAFAGVIESALGIAAAHWQGDCFFSIVTTPPARLAPIQRLPHFDGLEERRVAAVLFLSRADFGGTSFYRHRATGFETIDAARYPAYGAALQADVARHGLPPPDYIGDGAPIFDEIASFEPIFNRLLLYRGAALHCSRIRNAEALSADPRKGRLTLNLFLQPASG
jgi:hypothetical protein